MGTIWNACTTSRSCTTPGPSTSKRAASARSPTPTGRRPCATGTGSGRATLFGSGSRRAQVAEKAGPTIAALRERLPVLLLQVHYDIALCIGNADSAADTPHHRSKFHLQLVHRSPFPAAAKAKVQLAAFEGFVATLPKSLWDLAERNEEAIEGGIARIEKYLAVDPESQPALEEVLGLLARLLRSWLENLHAEARESPRHRALLHKIVQHGEKWRPFLDHLVGLDGRREDGVRDKLGFWYRLNGEVLRGLDREDHALPFFEQGVRATLPEDEEHRRCSDQFVETLAYLARQAAQEAKPNARAQCDRLRDREDLTLPALGLLAGAYLQLGVFDLAETVCRRGLAQEPRVDDNLEQMEKHEEHRRQLQELLDSMPVLRLHHEADRLMNAQKFDAALPHLNDAWQRDRKNQRTLFLRCQCHLNLEHFDDAEKDLRAFEPLVADRADGREAAANLQEAIQRGRLNSIVGQHLERAGQHLKNGEAAAAVKVLDRAAKDFPREEAVFFLRAQGYLGLRRFDEAEKDLRRFQEIVGNNSSHREETASLRQAIENGRRQAAVIQIVEQAQGHLENGRHEAALKALNDAAGREPKLAHIYFLRCQCQMALGHAAEARADLRKFEQHDDDRAGHRNIRDQLSEAIDRCEEQARFVRELGGPEAAKLRSAAVEAFNSDNFERAVEILRKARALAPNAAKLKEELSVALAVSAIQRANALTIRSSMADGRSALTTIRGMLLEAVQLDPNNENAQNALMQISGN